MQLAARLAYAFDQDAFDEGMDVFVGPRQEGGIGAAAFEDRGQATLNRLRLGGREHVGAGERLRPRHAASHVVFKEPLVEAEGRAPGEQRLVGLDIEAARPERLGRILGQGRCGCDQNGQDEKGGGNGAASVGGRHDVNYRS